MVGVHPVEGEPEAEVVAVLRARAVRLKRNGLEVATCYRKRLRVEALRTLIEASK